MSSCLCHCCNTARVITTGLQRLTRNVNPQLMERDCSGPWVGGGKHWQSISLSAQCLAKCPSGVKVRPKVMLSGPVGWPHWDTMSLLHEDLKWRMRTCLKKYTVFTFMNIGGIQQQKQSLWIYLAYSFGNESMESIWRWQNVIDWYDLTNLLSIMHVDLSRFVLKVSSGLGQIYSLGFPETY